MPLMARKSPNIPPQPPPRPTGSKPYNTRSSTRASSGPSTSPASQTTQDANSEAQPPQSSCANDDDDDEVPFEATALLVIAGHLDKLISEVEMPEQLAKSLAKLSRYAGKKGIKAGKKEVLQITTEDVREVRQDLLGEISANFKTLEAKIDSLANNQEQFLGATKELTKEASVMSKAVATVSSKATQLETTVNTYKDALLKAPTQTAPQRIDTEFTDPAIDRDVERKSRQVLINFSDDQITSLSEFEIKSRLYESLAQVSEPSAPKDLKVLEVSKLRNNGILILFNTKEAADWTQNLDTEAIFTAYLAPGATIRRRMHVLLVPKVPITLDPTDESHISEIEEANRLQKHSISKVKWIKPEKRRKPEQRLAHATFSFSSAEAANICIRDGILIHGVKIYPSKLKQDPTQCLKCRRWGHYASSCKETKDTCGTCGGNHWTKACSEPSRKFCASCNVNTHTSWDRQCPEFLKRCAQLDKTHPVNTLKYFPTKEPWTKVIRPAKIPFNERFPAHFAVASLPPPPAHDKARELPTRQLGSRRKRRSTSHAEGQKRITSFYKPNASQGRIDNQNADAVEEGEVYDPTDGSPFRSSDNSSHNQPSL